MADADADAAGSVRDLAASLTGSDDDEEETESVT